MRGPFLGYAMMKIGWLVQPKIGFVVNNFDIAA
jgi:hypothetical protein